MLTTRSLLNHFILAALVAMFVLCLRAGAEEGNASASRDLLALKLPQQTDVAAKKINERYYSLLDKKVATLSFKLTDSQMMAQIEDIKRRRQPGAQAAAEQLEKARLLVTYHVADGSSDLSLFNRPKVSSVDELEAGWKGMFLAFWHDISPHITRLVDPKRDRITHAKTLKGWLVVALVNGKGRTQTLVFDNAWKLRSWSGVDDETNAPYRKTLAYDSYEGKYLVKSLHGEASDIQVTYDLQYQSVNGVMVLKEVNTTIVGTGKFADLPPKFTMYFQDPQITFGR